MFRILPLVSPLLCAILAFAAYAENRRTGMQALELSVIDTPLIVRVFYPTNQPANTTAIGDWALDVTPDAPVEPGPFPLIMISHGLGGDDLNHHLLAQDLVQAGFVVGAVRHPDDLKRVGSQAILDLRPFEVSAALDAILSAPDIASAIDEDRIGAFGYSQGGLTILRNLGAEAYHQNLIDHCIANRKADDEFCTGRSAGFWRRLGQLTGKMFYSAPEIPPGHDVLDPRIKAAVIAAPVGAPITDLSRIKANLWLIRAANDQVLRHPFHVEKIHSDLTTKHDYSVLRDADHYSFLSPFPAKLAKEVGPPALDPDGFDRAAFLAKLNREITDWFAKTLN